MINIPAIGYFVSIFSYLFFIILEWLRPGFVSNFFSVHLFLLLAVIFGIWWGFACQTNKTQRFVSLGRVTNYILILLLAIGLFLFAWREGRAFGDFRLLVAICAFVVPWVVSKAKL